MKMKGAFILSKVWDDVLASQASNPEGRSLEAIDARLKRSGIPSRILYPSNQHDDHFVARYRVTVAGLDAVSVTKLMRGGSEMVWEKGGGIPGELADGLRKRLAKAAVRTLYALGTDRGEVNITAMPGRRYTVDQVAIGRKRASGNQHGKTVFLTAAGKGMNAQNPPFSEKGAGFLMGMDPEFVLVGRGGQVVEASLYLERRGAAGCDAVRSGDVVTYPLAELRPVPKSDPDALLIEMRRTLREAGRLITDPSLAWMAGGLPVKGLPLGGHIHFSGVPLSLDLLKCLDNYLALPLALLEDPSGRERRPRYGYLGDFRRQPYGGFEYRTLPSFLVSPLIAKASIYLAFLIARNHAKLPARPLDEDRYHKAYYEGHTEILRECSAALHRDIGNLQEAAPYARVIDRLFGLIAEGRTWDERRDIRPLWNIASSP